MKSQKNESSSVSTINLIDYVAEHSKNAPKVYFSRQQVSDEKTQLKIFQNKLHHAIAFLKKENCYGPMSFLLQKRFNDIIYKYGHSLKHQKFWRATRQAITELKRINRLDLINVLNKIDEGLVNSQYFFEPTKGAITYLGSIIIQKMIHLDRLRIYCIRAVYCCVGMAEIGHHLTVILLLITMNSELASEAERHYLVFREFYTYLMKFLHSADENLPETTDDIPFNSEQEKSGPPSQNFRFIMALTNFDQPDKINQFFRDWTSAANQTQASDLLKTFKTATNEEMKQAVEQSIPEKLKMMDAKRKKR